MRSINALARDLELEVIAEGIETAGQLEVLHRLGCHYGQGNFLCEPLSVRAVEPLLKAAQLPSERGGRRPRMAPSQALA